MVGYPGVAMNCPRNNSCQRSVGNYGSSNTNCLRMHRRKCLLGCVDRSLNIFFGVSSA
jgi:hypothetical protein